MKSRYAHRLGVLGVAIREFIVASRDDLVDLVRVEEVIACEAVHTLHQLLEGVSDDEVSAVLLECLHGSRGGAPQTAAEHGTQVAVGDVGVLLRTGKSELLLDDRLSRTNHE